MNALNKIIVAIKGFFMGAANVVPGVSGGTIALISGIYEELIESLNSLMKFSLWKRLFKGEFKGFWEEAHGAFLLSLLIGVIASVFTLAKLMEYELAFHPIQIWALFFGLILASAYYMLKDIKAWKLKDVFIALAGAVMGLLVCTLSPTSTPEDLWFIFICGAIAICTMILPGISGSFILVIFGKYDYIMSAVSELNIPVLVVFALGCCVGILAFAKFLGWLLSKYERQTMLVLVGFVIGSLVKVWPWADINSVANAQLLRSGIETDTPETALQTLENLGMNLNYQLPSAIVWCIAGIGIIVLIQTLSSSKKNA